jgi:hypothetical protein
MVCDFSAKITTIAAHGAFATIALVSIKLYHPANPFHDAQAN